MAAAQEEDFVDYEEEEEQVAVQTGKDTKKYEKILIPHCFFFMLVRATIPGGWKQFPVGFDPAIEIILFNGIFFSTKIIATKNRAKSNTNIYFTNYFPMDIA